MTCEVGLRVLKLDPKQEQLQLRLEVKYPESKPELPDTRATFNVGYFDFPSRQHAPGERTALRGHADEPLPAAADLTTVCFPGEFASLKDRPYYDEVIQKLREANVDDVTPQAGWIVRIARP